MKDDKIICPHCQAENEALDDENCDIGFTVMECIRCDEEFNMSRTVAIEYSTW